MAMEYINYIKSKAKIGLSSKSEQPVLSDEDERFLSNIASQGNPRPRVDHGGDAQIALLDGAQMIPLPPETAGELSEEPETLPEASKKDTGTSRLTWSWLRRDSRDHKQETAEGLHDIAQGLKSTEDDALEDAEVKKEEEDMTIVLEKLNLAAINNRVFSISDETQELLQKFNQVLKDLMNGVPTAYNDLESLLTNGDKQLQKTYNALPQFLQKLIEKLPETMTKGMAPEMMAAAAERASRSGINLEKAGKAAGVTAKFMKTPSLKDLLGKPGAITAMLRSILNFLRARFPAFAGMNVLWSLALFILLFVFWYCHKRGKESRQEKERQLTDEEVQQLEKEWEATHEGQKNLQPPSTTTAAPGASIEQVKEGVIEAEALKAATEAATQSEPATVQPTLAAEMSQKGTEEQQK